MNIFGDEQRKAYERFAAETYATFHQAIDTEVKNAPQGQDVLIVSGELHQDSFTHSNAERQGLVPIQDYKPAIAIAFSHISAIEAAIRTVGKDNVRLSVELPPYWYKSEQELKEASSSERHKYRPMHQAINYALSRGIPVTLSDTYRTADLDAKYQKNQNVIINSEERERGMITSILSLANKDDNKKIVVVNIVGVAHLSNLMGYTDQEVLDSNGIIVVDPNRNPFSGTFHAVVFTNTNRDAPIVSSIREAQLSPMQSRGRSHEDIYWDTQLRAERVFYTDPKNAIQIHAPGAIPADVVPKIAQMVEQAAVIHHAGGQITGGVTSNMQSDQKRSIPATPK